MKTIRILLLAIAATTVFSVAIDGQTKKKPVKAKTTVNKAATLPPLDVRAARVKVDNQLANVRAFVSRLGPVAQAIEALDAEAKVGLKMNIAQKNLQNLLQSLPSLRNPTVSGLSQNGWVAVETIIDEHVVRDLIPKLKAAGAEGIIEYPLNKVVY